jgi:hypothetical protein
MRDSAEQSVREVFREASSADQAVQACGATGFQWQAFTAEQAVSQGIAGRQCRAGRKAGRQAGQSGREAFRQAGQGRQAGLQAGQAGKCEAKRSTADRQGCEYQARIQVGNLGTSVRQGKVGRHGRRGRVEQADREEHSMLARSAEQAGTQVRACRQGCMTGQAGRDAGMQGKQAGTPEFAGGQEVWQTG